MQKTKKVASKNEDTARVEKNKKNLSALAITTLPLLN